MSPPGDTYVAEQPFVIAGAGGLGREALDVALSVGTSVDAFLDDATSGSAVRGLPVLAPGDCAEGTSYLIAIADPAARARLADLLDGRGLSPRTLVHATALVAPETGVGRGVLLMAGCYVSSGVTVGDHSQVQYAATVGHDSVLGARVTVLPGARVSGAVQLDDGSTVGSGAVVLQGRRIGAGAFVGAGAVVTRDVAPGEVVVGNPARRLR